MTDRTKDIETMRRTFENPTEWRVRKAFLEKNYNALDRERLIILSNCFINHELYGCGYPEKIMSEIRKWGDGVIDSVYMGKADFAALHIK
ncbi:unnamed protein product [Rodentolepis nana]|uniref:XRN2-binding (XTBD) domain-containing protein n=1 Tax=Rodentolepis nana TaxID=102285 RepID=A0A0R3T0K2_RODNA|nr:unnamed protein product [Rodentolepis nana]